MIRNVHVWYVCVCRVWETRPVFPADICLEPCIEMWCERLLFQTKLVDVIAQSLIDVCAVLCCAVLCCDVMWYDVVWCGVVLCGVLSCGVLILTGITWDLAITSEESPGGWVRRRRRPRGRSWGSAWPAPTPLPPPLPQAQAQAPVRCSSACTATSPCCPPSRSLRCSIPCGPDTTATP